LPAETKNSAAPQALVSVIVAAMIGIAIYGTFLWAPNEKTMGFLQRIFYFHAASGQVMILAFGIVFI
jgi:heme exporter protein C